MSNLPELPRRHFNLTVTERFDNLADYCINGLLIPVGHLFQYEAVRDMDSYWVYTRNGCRFMVSGPELVEWEKVCVPGRDS
jgi:hypothetical protein